MNFSRDIFCLGSIVSCSFLFSMNNITPRSPIEDSNLSFSPNTIETNIAEELLGAFEEDLDLGTDTPKDKSKSNNTLSPSLSSKILSPKQSYLSRGGKLSNFPSNSFQKSKCSYRNMSYTSAPEGLVNTPPNLELNSNYYNKDFHNSEKLYPISDNKASFNSQEREISSSSNRSSVSIHRNIERKFCKKRSITAPSSPTSSDNLSLKNLNEGSAPITFTKYILSENSCNNRFLEDGRRALTSNNFYQPLDPMFEECKRILQKGILELTNEKEKYEKKLFKLQEDINEFYSGKRDYLVITLDGGGSRGIVEILFLKELKRRINNKKEQRLISIDQSEKYSDKKTLKESVENNYKLKFDMVAGTSVGALIGMGFILDKLDDIENNYQQLVNDIFYPQFSCFGLCGPKYKSTHKEIAFSRYLGESTAKNSIHDVDLIVPYFSVHTKEPVVYKNYDTRCKDIHLLDLAMATSAAPTYFDPYPIDPIDPIEDPINNNVDAVDGGIFANHPGGIAYFEAKKRYPNATHISMISLGTGYESVSNTKDYYGMSIIKWAPDVIDMAMTATSNLTNKELLLADEMDDQFSYVRIQLGLNKDNLKLDNKDPAGFQDIKNAFYNALKSAATLTLQFDKATSFIINYLEQFVEQNEREIQKKKLEQEYENTLIKLKDKKKDLNNIKLELLKSVEIANITDIK